MDRRNFLKTLGVLVGGIALEQAVPLGRVYSFPKELKCLNSELSKNRFVMNRFMRTVAQNYYDPAAVLAFNTGPHFETVKSHETDAIPYSLFNCPQGAIR